MNRKRLLIATDSFLPRWDGIARFLNEIIPRLVEQYDVTIVAPHFGKVSYYDKVKIKTFPVRKFSMDDYSPAKVSFGKLKKLVKEHDIIFVQTQGPIGAKCILLSKFLSKPVISYVHSIEWELFSKATPKMRGIIKFFTKIYSRYLYNSCDMLMIPFLELKEIMRRYGIKKPEMVVVHLGTDIEKFKPTTDLIKAKEKLGINPDNFVIGFVGRISREKDLPTLFKAFYELEKHYNNLTLLIVGKGIKDYKKDFNSKNVMAVGKKDDVVSYLHAMDIFVLPSLTETTSLVTIEAMSCAIPVIVTPVGYVKGYVKDKFNGLIFPKKNALILKLKIKQLIEDRELREKLSRHARATVVKKFDWARTVERLKFLLNQF